MDFETIKSFYNSYKYPLFFALVIVLLLVLMTMLWSSKIENFSSDPALGLFAPSSTMFYGERSDIHYSTPVRCATPTPMPPVSANDADRIQQNGSMIEAEIDPQV